MAQRSLWRFYSKKENASVPQSSQPLLSNQNPPASSQGPWGSTKDPAKAVSDSSPFKTPRNPYAFSGTNEGTEPKGRVIADQPSLNKPPPSQRSTGYSDPRRTEPGDAENGFGTPSARAGIGRDGREGRASFSPRPHFTPLTPGIKPCVPRAKRGRDDADVDDNANDYSEGLTATEQEVCLRDAA
ncbi:hypothetical protein CLOP_g19566 [Closterium sp. NIES-67]|nr:hypothetical protein CLOP_g19566 [Closterium sp. NIES-67]